MLIILVNESINAVKLGANLCKSDFNHPDSGKVGKIFMGLGESMWLHYLLIIKSFQQLISEEIKNTLDSKIFRAKHFQNEHNETDEIQSGADL